MPSAAKEPNKSESTEDAAYSVSSRPSRPRSGVGNQDDWITMRIPKMRMPKPQVSQPRIKSVGLVVALLLTLFVGFLGGIWGAKQQNNSGFLSGDLSNQKKVVTSESQLISQIAKTLGPSVVSVDVTSQTQPSASPFDSFFGFGSGSGAQQQESAGTGIILNSDGLIITNRHVVPAGTTSVSVTLSDGTQLDNVQVVGRTKDSDSLDIAFLKITDAKGHKLTPAVVGESSKVQVGDAVVAIGNALGQFQNTVTSGIISGYGRSVQAGDSSGSSSSTENLDDLFQTDAAINEGNSGGPLVNLNGQVIGINTAIASGSQNIGFAIPIDDVKGLIKQVESTGKLVRPYVGVRYTLVTADVAKRYNLSVQNGAFIIPSADPTNSPSILSGSPAEKAELKEGDVITQIDGTDIDQTHSVTSIISKHAVGDSLDFTVVRNGKTIHKTVTLEAQPDN